jgi:hypothetical protein
MFSLNHPKPLIQNNNSRKVYNISHNFNSLTHGPIQLKLSFNSLSSKSPKRMVILDLKPRIALLTKDCHSKVSNLSVDFNTPLRS